MNLYLTPTWVGIDHAFTLIDALDDFITVKSHISWLFVALNCLPKQLNYFQHSMGSRALRCEVTMCVLLVTGVP